MGYVQGDAYRIVVGFDFTDLGHLALHGAINTAMATPGAELHVLGALGPGYGLGPVRGGDIEAVNDAQMQIESLVGQALASRGADGVSFYVHARISGAPAVAIVELANEQDAEFIVIGTHGRHGMDRFVHGSTAEHVVRDADCPVLVMRHKVEHHRAVAPRAEAPCEACLQRRRITEGAELWCEAHHQAALSGSTDEHSSLASGSGAHDWTRIFP